MSRWLSLTWQLPLAARLGRESAIIEWLAHMSRTRDEEIIVWLDRSKTFPVVRAGTSRSNTSIDLPEHLLRMLDDPRRRIEIWHNHPASPDMPSVAAPSYEDIALTTARGIEALSTIDNDGRSMRITSRNPKHISAAAVREWVLCARTIKRAELVVERHERGLPRTEASDIEISVASIRPAIAAARAEKLIYAPDLSEAENIEGRRLAAKTNFLRGSPSRVASEAAQESTPHRSRGQKKLREPSDSPRRSKNKKHNPDSPGR